MNMLRRRSNIFDDFWNFHRELDHFFGGNEQARWSSDFTPQVDVQEKNGHFVMNMDLPGIRKEDLNVHLEDNMLTISGERKSEIEDSEEGYFRRERSFGSFQRSFSLPNNVDADRVECHFENGVLTLAIPKKEISKGKKLTINEGKPNFLKKILGGKEEAKAS